MSTRSNRRIGIAQWILSRNWTLRPIKYDDRIVGCFFFSWPLPLLSSISRSRSRNSSSSSSSSSSNSSSSWLLARQMITLQRNPGCRSMPPFFRPDWPNWIRNGYHSAMQEEAISDDHSAYHSFSLCLCLSVDIDAVWGRRGAIRKRHDQHRVRWHTTSVLMKRDTTPRLTAVISKRQSTSLQEVCHRPPWLRICTVAYCWTSASQLVPSWMTFYLPRSAIIRLKVDVAWVDWKHRFGQWIRP